MPIDFAAKLAELRARRGPAVEPEKDPNILEGTLPCRIVSRGIPDERRCSWEIGPYQSNHGEWVVFKIVKGGVTGYESFVLKDDRGPNQYILDWLFKKESNGEWCANAGGSGWPEMWIPKQAIREAVQQWLDREGIKPVEE